MYRAEKKIIEEYQIEDPEAFQRALIEAQFLMDSIHPGSGVDKGTDKLDAVAELLSSAADCIKEAHEILNEPQEFGRLARPPHLDDEDKGATGLSDREIDEIGELLYRLPTLVPPIQRMAELAATSHRKPGKGNPGLDHGLIGAFEIICRFWRDDCGRKLSNTFHIDDEDVHSQRIEPGSDAVRFTWKVMNLLVKRAVQPKQKFTKENHHTLWTNYLIK